MSHRYLLVPLLALVLSCGGLLGEELYGDPRPGEPQGVEACDAFAEIALEHYVMQHLYLDVDGRRARLTSTPPCRETGWLTLMVESAFVWEDRVTEDYDLRSGRLSLGLHNARQRVDPGSYEIPPERLTREEDLDTPFAFGSLEIKDAPLTDGRAVPHRLTGGSVTMTDSGRIDGEYIGCRTVTFENLVLVPEAGGAPKTVSGRLACSYRL